MYLLGKTNYFSCQLLVSITVAKAVTTNASLEVI
jgi:hypothetical protein